MKKLIALTILFASASTFAQIPEAWHQPPTRDEVQIEAEILDTLRTAPDFPTLKNPALINVIKEPQNMQINAWETKGQIFVPVEIQRAIQQTSDPVNTLAFLIAHEAGHAKQEQIYGKSCYAANVKTSKFDLLRTLADAGGAIGTHQNLPPDALKKQTCEDHADAWAVRFMTEAGLNPNGGIVLFNMLSSFSQQGLQMQFVSDHSINPERIAHTTYLIHQNKPLNEQQTPD